MVKNNAFLLRMGAWIVGVIFAAGCVYGVVHYRLGDVEDDVVEVKAEANVTDERVGKVEDAVIRIQGDISYIQRDVAKILKKFEGE